MSGKLIARAMTFFCSLVFLSCASHNDSNSLSEAQNSLQINAAMVGTTWRVTDYFLPSPCAESGGDEICAQVVVQANFTTQVEMTFNSDKSFNLTGPCNLMGGKYNFISGASAGQVQVTLAQSTLRACDVLRETEEKQLQILLSNTKTFETNGVKLKLKTVHGSYLNLQKIK